MSRNIQFSILFGLIFYGLAVLMFVPDTFPTIIDSLWLAPALMVGFFFLRYMTLLAEKASGAGARMVDNLLPEQAEAEAAEPPAPSEPRQETFLQMLTGLILVGPWITLGLALVAPIVAFVLVLAIPGVAEWDENRQFGLSVILASIIAVPWLLGLQWWGGVRINVPIIPIPMLWLTPFALIFGLYLFFTAPSTGSSDTTPDAAPAAAGGPPPKS